MKRSTHRPTLLGSVAIVALSATFGQYSAVAGGPPMPWEHPTPTPTPKPTAGRLAMSDMPPAFAVASAPETHIVKKG